MKVMPRFGLILDKRYTLAELIDRLLADGNGSSATILAITNPNFDEYHYNISDYPSLEFNHGKIQRDDIPEELKWHENDIVKLFYVIGLLLAMAAITYGVWL